MKRTTLLLLSLSFLWNCNRFSAEYDINCVFEQLSSGRKATLIVVDYAGDVLQTFEITNGNSFSGKAITRDGDSPDYYDLHLVVGDTFSSSALAYSMLGVKNGSQAYLGPSVEPFFDFGIVKPVVISGVQSLNDVAFSSWFSSPVFSPLTQTITGTIRAENNESAILRLRANDESEFRSLFIPDSIIAHGSDTLLYSWGDFKFEHNLQKVTLKGQEPDYYYAIAIDQSFRRWAYAGRPFSLVDNSGEFNIPENWPDYLNQLAVYAQRGNTAYERIFRLGDPLEFASPNMAISNWVMHSGKMQIHTTGAVDLIQLSVSQDAITPSGFGAYFAWQITGNPADFADRKRPDIGQWLPDWVNLPTTFSKGTIRAYRFDLYDDLDVKAGFPFRSNERFIYARSGMTNVWQNF